MQPKRYNTGDIKREKKGERKWLICSTTSWQASGFLLLVLIHVGENKLEEKHLRVLFLIFVINLYKFSDNYVKMDKRLSIYMRNL